VWAWNKVGDIMKIGGDRRKYAYHLQEKSKATRRERKGKGKKETFKWNPN